MNTHVKNQTLYAVCCLFIAMLCVQSSGALAKILFQDFSVPMVSAMRLLIGGTLLALIFKVWTIQWQQVRWRVILFYGLSIAGMNLLFYSALQRIPLGIAVAFEFLGPLLVALAHARKRIDVLWVMLVMLGLSLVLPITQHTKSLDPLGVLFALGAGACWALYIVVGQRPTGLSGNHTVCLGMLIGMLCVLPILVFSPQLSAAFQPDALIMFSVLAVLASALPFSLEMFALRNLSTLSFGTLMSLEPAAATLSGLLFLNEQLTWIQGIALVCIMLASIGCTLTSNTQQS